jgi:hypothetical protein
MFVIRGSQLAYKQSTRLHFFRKFYFQERATAIYSCFGFFSAWDLCRNKVALLKRCTFRGNPRLVIVYRIQFQGTQSENVTPRHSVIRTENNVLVIIS